MSEKSEARKKMKGTPVGEVVDRLDDNTRGIVKIVSAMYFLQDGGVSVEYEMLKSDGLLRELITERRKLRDQLEAYLMQQKRS